MHTLHHSGRIEREELESLIAIRPGGRIKQGRCPKALHESAELAGRDGALLQIDEMNVDPALPEEPERRSRGLRILVAEQLDGWSGLR